MNNSYIGGALKYASNEIQNDPAFITNENKIEILQIQ